MNKKLLSTILLFVVFATFLWWGMAQLLHPDPQNVGESIVFSLLLLGCSGYALVSILLLPRKKQP